MFSNLQECCLGVSATLLDAMRVIEQGAAKVALVVDDSNRLRGILTDGDIRRAILGGAILDSNIAPHICEDYLRVTKDIGRAEVLDLMKAYTIDQVPILDDDGQLVGLHLLHGLIGSQECPNWAVIMAGGKGVRLRPLTEHLPKPMIKVAGRPILERLVLHLIGYGVKRIFLATNYMGQLIEDYFGDGKKFGCSIEYLREEEPMGTGGALSLLPEVPTDPLLVMNGDLVMEANLQQMLNFHKRGRYYATVGAHEYTHQVPYGCIMVDGDRVLGMEEKPIASYLINAGLYVLSPEAVADIPKEYFPLTNLFEEAIKKDRPCGRFFIQGEWADVGQVTDLRKTQGYR